MKILSLREQIERVRRQRSPLLKKYFCYQVMHEATRRGYLKMQPCEVCGHWNSQRHHDDYNEPLKVRYLCRKHHREADWRRRRQSRC